MQRQSNVAEPIPPFFLTTLKNLEDSLNAALAKEKEAKKKMNAVNARALNSMKQEIHEGVRKGGITILSCKKCIQICCSSSNVPQDPEAFEHEYTLQSQPVEAASAKAKKPPKKIVDSGSEEEKSAAEDFTTVGKGGKAM
jgi:translation initiation factor 3 subunit C